MCFTVISIPILAADRGSNEPDAVAGARSGLYTQVNSGSSGTYVINVPAQKGGTVRSEVSDCARGCCVDIKVEADTGYEMASVAVISASGNALEIEQRDGAYCFVMPGENVIVDVTFH